MTSFKIRANPTLQTLIEDIRSQVTDSSVNQAISNLEKWHTAAEGGQPYPHFSPQTKINVDQGDNGSFHYFILFNLSYLVYIRYYSNIDSLDVNIIYLCSLPNNSPNEGLHDVGSISKFWGWDDVAIKNEDTYREFCALRDGIIYEHVSNARRRIKKIWFGIILNFLLAASLLYFQDSLIWWPLHFIAAFWSGLAINTIVKITSKRYRRYQQIVKDFRGKI